MLFITAASGAETPTDLSSPTSALKSYIRMKRTGWTLKDFQDLVSKENFTIVSAMNLAMMGNIDLSEKKPPENKYSKLKIMKRQTTDDRAIFQVKVSYKDSWLKQEAQELKETGMDNISPDQKTGGNIISEAGPGEDSEYPYHIKGEGYISFLFLKQEGTWRFHKSYATITNLAISLRC